MLECEKFILGTGLRDLIENTTKYTKSRIKIEVINSDNSITFFISDHKESNAMGANISKDTNSGVGLTATRSLIESRQGKIWLDELYLDGKGATIAFSVFG
jgi:K+-sensing histidine kinase KdpD